MVVLQYQILICIVLVCWYRYQYHGVHSIRSDLGVFAGASAQHATRIEIQMHAMYSLLLECVHCVLDYTLVSNMGR